MGHDANRNTHLKALQASQQADNARQLVLGLVNLNLLQRITWLFLGPKYLNPVYAVKGKIILAILLVAIVALVAADVAVLCALVRV